MYVSLLNNNLQMEVSTMMKYLGIIKKQTESAIGINIQILTKFSNSKSSIKQWTKLYPSSETILLNNSVELEKFFMDFEDNTPVTEIEKVEAKKLYEKLMKE